MDTYEIMSILTESQKDELSKILFNKIKFQIENIKFDTSKINLSSSVSNLIKSILSDDGITDGFYENIDYKKIGKVLSDIIANSLIKGTNNE